MRVTVHIYSYLRRYMPAAEELIRNRVWDVAEGATIREVVARLELPDEVQITILLNSNSVDHTAVLKEGDIIHILPIMGGG